MSTFKVSFTRKSAYQSVPADIPNRYANGYGFTVEADLAADAAMIAARIVDRTLLEYDTILIHLAEQVEELAIYRVRRAVVMAQIARADLPKHIEGDRRRLTSIIGQTVIGVRWHQGSIVVDFDGDQRSIIVNTDSLFDEDGMYFDYDGTA